MKKPIIIMFLALLVSAIPENPSEAQSTSPTKQRADAPDPSAKSVNKITSMTSASKRTISGFMKRTAQMCLGLLNDYCDSLESESSTSSTSGKPVMGQGRVVLRNKPSHSERPTTTSNPTVTTTSITSSSKASKEPISAPNPPSIATPIMQRTSEDPTTITPNPPKSKPNKFVYTPFSYLKSPEDTIYINHTFYSTSENYNLEADYKPYLNAYTLNTFNYTGPAPAFRMVLNVAERNYTEADAKIKRDVLRGVNQSFRVLGSSGGGVSTAASIVGSRPGSVLVSVSAGSPDDIAKTQKTYEEDEERLERLFGEVSTDKEEQDPYAPTTVNFPLTE